MSVYQRMGILPLKKRVNRDKCSLATKQRMFGVFAIEEPGSPVPALYATLGWSKSETINKMLRNILPVTPNQTDTINITMHDHTFASHFTNHAIGFTSTLLYFTYSLHFKVNSTIHIFKHMGCMAEESPHFGLFGEHVDWFPRLLWEQFHRVLLVGNLRSLTKFIGKKDLGPWQL